MLEAEEFVTCMMLNHVKVSGELVPAACKGEDRDLPVLHEIGGRDRLILAHHRGQPRMRLDGTRVCHRELIPCEKLNIRVQMFRATATATSGILKPILLYTSISCRITRLPHL